MNFLDKILLNFLGFYPAKKIMLGVHACSRNLAFLEKIIDGQDILDVGSGLGLTGEYLSSRGFNAKGIELDRGLAEESNKRHSYKICTASASQMPFADNSFDAVIFMYVLHHIPKAEHGKILEEASRVLRATGKIIIMEPGEKSVFDRIWDGLFFRSCFYGYFSMEGKFNFTPKRGARIFEIMKKDISSIKFKYGVS